MNRSPEVRDRIISLEDRVERVQLRRSALPIAFLLFAVLAFFLMGEEIQAASSHTTSFAWILLFGAASIIGLTLNEITARRSLRNLNCELDLLRPTSPANPLPRAHELP